MFLSKSDLHKLKQKPITLGVDPELALEDKQGRLLPANSTFYPDDPTNEPFGYDGHSRTAEVRTKKYSSDPAAVIRELKGILEKAKAKYPEAYQHNLKATSRHLSLGGHIHFGHPLLTSPLTRETDTFPRLTDNLDLLLAFPSVYLDNLPNRKRRAENEYGYLGDARHQPWGLEYRTLSSFLASKELASCNLYVAHSVADATIKHDFKVKWPVDREEFKGVFNENLATSLLRPNLKSVFQQLSKLPLYSESKEHKRWTDYLIRSVVGNKPLFSIEIKKGWKIEFEIEDFYNLERIETLADKITQLLVQIHKEDRKELALTRLLEGSNKDFACPTIAENVSMAIVKSMSQRAVENTKWKHMAVYGLSKKRENEIWLHAPFDTKKQKQFLSIAWDLAAKIPHKTKVRSIRVKQAHEPFSADDQRLGGFNIGFGRKVREENILLAESISLLAFLLANPGAHKSTEKNGKVRKKLYVTKKKLSESLVKNTASSPIFNIKVNLKKNIKLGLSLPAEIKTSKAVRGAFDELKVFPLYHIIEIQLSLHSELKKLVKNMRIDCDCSPRIAISSQGSTKLNSLCLSCMSQQILSFFQNYGALTLYPCQNCGMVALKEDFNSNTGRCSSCHKKRTADEKEKAQTYVRLNMATITGSNSPFRIDNVEDDDD